MSNAIAAKNAFALKLAAITMAIGSAFAVSSIASTDGNPAVTGAVANTACLRCWI